MRPQQNRELDIANFEDLTHLSALWSKHDLTNADIRQGSNIVRRLLVYKEIVGSASPRSIRLLINSPDNKPLIRAASNGHLDFFQSGGTTVMGVWFRASTLSQKEQQLHNALHSFDPEATLQLKLDSFLDQPVFFFDNVFITRRSVVLYVANKAAGTHFDTERQDEFAILDRVRSVVSMQLRDGVPCFGFNVDASVAADENFLPSGKGIDPVFIELAAAVRHLTESSSVQRLIAQLKQELGL